MRWMRRTLTSPHCGSRIRTVEDACPYKVCVFKVDSHTASSCLPRRGRGTTKWWKESPPCCGSWITDAQCAPLRDCAIKAGRHTAFSKSKPHHGQSRTPVPTRFVCSRRVAAPLPLASLVEEGGPLAVDEENTHIATLRVEDHGRAMRAPTRFVCSRRVAAPPSQSLNRITDSRGRLSLQGLCVQGE